MMQLRTIRRQELSNFKDMARGRMARFGEPGPLSSQQVVACVAGGILLAKGAISAGNAIRDTLRERRDRSNNGIDTGSIGEVELTKSQKDTVRREVENGMVKGRLSEEEVFSMVRRAGAWEYREPIRRVDTSLRQYEGVATTEGGRKIRIEIKETDDQLGTMYSMLAFPSDAHRRSSATEVKDRDAQPRIREIWDMLETKRRAKIKEVANEIREEMVLRRDGSEMHHGLMDRARAAFGGRIKEHMGLRSLLGSQRSD
ncbi:MAG: hypothetical protein KGH72_00605 [Candidatus Micrarchaeota archaeon]|nr:hypothetical protein [Candidatus Micrarchaeota archaeon]